ncbi:unnamed protein product, partial [Mycena citricolor]
ATHDDRAFPSPHTPRISYIHISNNSMWASRDGASDPPIISSSSRLTTLSIQIRRRPREIQSQQSRAKAWLFQVPDPVARPGLALTDALHNANLPKLSTQILLALELFIRVAKRFVIFPTM